MAGSSSTASASSSSTLWQKALPLGSSSSSSLLAEAGELDAVSATIMEPPKDSASDDDKRRYLDYLSTLSTNEAALAAFATSINRLSILSDWLKSASKRALSSQTEDFLAHFIRTVQKLPLSKVVLDESKLGIRLKKLAESDTFSPKLRGAASTCLKTLKTTASELPSQVSLPSASLKPLTVPTVASASPRSALASSTPKRIRRDIKKVSWGDHPVTPRPSDSYGGWGLTATKEIPNLDELREAITAGFAQLSATGSDPSSPKALAEDVAKEKRRLERHRKSLQLDLLKERAQSKPWRTPRDIEIPDDLAEFKKAIAYQEPLVLVASEIKEIPAFPVETTPRPRSTSPSKPPTYVPNKAKSVEYDPEDTYDPGNVYSYEPSAGDDGLNRKKTSRFEPLPSEKPQESQAERWGTTGRTGDQQALAYEKTNGPFHAQPQPVYVHPPSYSFEQGRPFFHQDQQHLPTPPSLPTEQRSSFHPQPDQPVLSQPQERPFQHQQQMLSSFQASHPMEQQARFQPNPEQLQQPWPTSPYAPAHQPYETQPQSQSQPPRRKQSRFAPLNSHHPQADVAFPPPVFSNNHAAPAPHHHIQQQPPDQPAYHQFQFQSTVPAYSHQQHAAESYAYVDQTQPSLHYPAVHEQPFATHHSPHDFQHMNPTSYAHQPFPQQQPPTMPGANHQHAFHQPYYGAPPPPAAAPGPIYHHLHHAPPHY